MITTCRRCDRSPAGSAATSRAFTAGLTLPYNSGAVEGTVNKIKARKMQLFGRAKPDLLRKLILLS